MNNSPYSGIDQEPNGKPNRPAGTPPTDATPSSPQRTAPPPPPPNAQSTGNSQSFRRLDRSGPPENYRGRSTGFVPGATRSIPQAWSNTHTDELAMSRMDDEGAAQSPHMRNESGEFPRQTSSSWWQKESLVASDVMTTRPRTVTPDARLRDIAAIMRSEDVGAVPVVHGDGRLWGMITDRDIVIRALAGDKSIDTCTAKDIATTDLDVATPDDSLSRIIELMGRERIRRVPVVDADDRLVGIVSMADVAQHADHHEDLQHALRRISARRSFWSRIWR
jgi:CBS domain-containing protein